jgi:hypothetical protein
MPASPSMPTTPPSRSSPIATTGSTVTGTPRLAAAGIPRGKRKALKREQEHYPLRRKKRGRGARRCVNSVTPGFAGKSEVHRLPRVRGRDRPHPSVRASGCAKRAFNERCRPPAVGAVGNVTPCGAARPRTLILPRSCWADSVRPPLRNVRVDQLAGRHDLPANPP